MDAQINDALARNVAITKKRFSSEPHFPPSVLWTLGYPDLIQHGKLVVVTCSQHEWRRASPAQYDLCMSIST